MIVDCHVNIWEEEHLNDEYIKQLKTSRKKELPIRCDSDFLYQKLNRADKIIIFGLKYKESLGIEVPDEVTANAVKKYPDKFIGFSCVNPNDSDALEKLKYAIEELGLRGLKMGPIYQNFHVMDPCVQPIYQYCQEQNIPITMHMGTTFCKNAPLDYGRPIHVDKVALKFPELKIIMAHLAHPWGAECIACFRKNKNVYSEMTGLTDWPYHFYHTMVIAQEYDVCHKIFFGTDYPFTELDEAIEGMRNLNEMVEGTKMPKISKENIEMIIHSNPLEHWWHK